MTSQALLRRKRETKDQASHPLEHEGSTIGVTGQHTGLQGRGTRFGSWQWSN
jgi:hypothetical protein